MWLVLLSAYTVPVRSKVKHCPKLKRSIHYDSGHVHVVSVSFSFFESSTESKKFQAELIFATQRAKKGQKQQLCNTSMLPSHALRAHILLQITGPCCTIDNQKSLHVFMYYGGIVGRGTVLQRYFMFFTA